MPMRTVDAITLKEWLDKGEAVLIDVREPAEHAAENIADAILIPLATLSKQALPNLAGKKLVIHCRGGKRGGTACNTLLADDASLDIYNLEGGITAWAQAGFKVHHSGGFFLPLDQQVQLAIGLGLLLSVLLGYEVHSGFFMLAGLFGLGLTVAGLTGFCGLAVLMARMPWNQHCATPTRCCAIK